MKRALKAGSVEIEEVIAHPPRFAEQANIADLLLALLGVGPDLWHAGAAFVSRSEVVEVVVAEPEPGPAILPPAVTA